MSLYADNRIVNLNSSDANKINGTYLSNVTFNLYNILKDETDLAYSTIGCINALIPVSWYTINYTNNILNILINGTPYTITLVKGNYTATTLINEIISEFALLFKTYVITDTLNVTLNQSTGILSFFFSNNSYIVQFLYSGSQGLFSVLGFDSATNYSSGGTGLITCPYPLNLLGITKLKICSSLLSTYSFDSSQTYSGQIIQTIPVNAPSWGLVNFINQSSFYGTLRNRRIDSIDIQILDQNNNFINFNNIDWTITLILTIYRTTKFQSSVLDLSPLEIRLEQIDSDIKNLEQPESSESESEQTANEGIHPSLDNDLEMLLYNNPQI